MVGQAARRAGAMSVRPSPLKSPASTRAPGVAAQLAKSGALLLVTVKKPLPLEKATGMVAQPAPPARAMSVRPSPLKSPASTRAPGVVAQLAKSGALLLVTVKKPLPVENATGMV